MTKHLKNFLYGVGSVLEIAPPARAKRFVNREPEGVVLRRDLQRVGDDMRAVLEAQADVGRRPRKAS